MNLTMDNSQASIRIYWNSDPSKYWRTRLSSRVSGSLDPQSERAKGSKFGPMVRCMKAGGEIARPTVKADLSMLMVMYMMDSG